MPAIRRRWTTAEVRALMDESRAWPRYELLDGELLVTPAPGSPHQIAVGELHLAIAPYVDREGLGVTLMSPADLELKPGEITQPDIFVVPPGSGTLDEPTPWSHISALLLAVEVLSPSSVRNDRILKREHYMESGVAEYWIVDIESRMIERWYVGHERPVVERGLLRWTPSPDRSPLDIDLEDLFARIARKNRLLNGGSRTLPTE